VHKDNVTYLHPCLLLYKIAIHDKYYFLYALHDVVNYYRNNQELFSLIVDF